MNDDHADATHTATLSRRSVLKVAVAGAGALAIESRASAMFAQAEPSPATPSASPVIYAGPVGTLSPSRDEVDTAIRDHFALADPTSTGGTLIQVATVDITTLNPQIPSDTPTQQVLELLFESLVRTNPLDGSYAPGLADSWELASDGVTYTFHLNPGVTWHDGTPFSADDVVYSFDSAIDETSLNPRRGDVVSVLRSHRKVDDVTVELVATGPIATFIGKAVFTVPIVPRHLWQNVPVANWGADTGSTGADATRVVGTGPFIFKEWTENDHLTLAKNPAYWDSSHLDAVIDEYILQVVPDPNASVQALVTGVADIKEVEASQALTLADDSAITLHVFDTFGFDFYMANLAPDRTPLFTDVRVRQALLYALDRDLVAETIYSGYAVRADGTQSPPSPAYAPERLSTHYTFEPDKARALLAEAGWGSPNDAGVLTRDGIPFAFETEYPDGIATYQQEMPYLQQAWKDIGIAMTPIAVPGPTLVDHAMAGAFDMIILGFSLTVDPDQSSLFGTEGLPPAGLNLMRYINPEFDAITPRASAELDPAKRIELIIAQTDIVNEDAAIGAMTFNKAVIAAGARLHNFNPNAYSTLWSIPYVWLEE